MTKVGTCHYMDDDDFQIYLKQSVAISKSLVILKDVIPFCEKYASTYPNLIQDMKKLEDLLLLREEEEEE